ncbi:MAG: ABC transporter permease [Salinivirgaceae bacterium]|nr:ABC transporter permease [Salinivirgaceae bacterium]MDD4748241.1 ABC transporter permease [Salinivirgaceae bacterium]
MKISLYNWFVGFYRRFKKSPFFTLINIAGLSIGFACFVLIGLYIINETEYDKYHPDYERVFRIAQIGNYNGVVENSSSVPFPLKDALEKEYPDLIESIVRVFNFQNPSQQITSEKTSAYDDGIFFVDPEFFDVFDYTLLCGSLSDMDSAGFTVVITESAEKKYFGEQSGLGQKMLINDWRDLTVVAVISDPPSQTHFQYSMLVSMETVKIMYRGKLPSTWVWNPCWTYVKLREGRSKNDLEKHFPEFVNKYFFDVSRQSNSLFLQPLENIHLYSRLDYEIAQNGSLSNVYIYSGLAIFIIIMAIINFMNLSTATASNRSRGITIRKITGASRTVIMGHILFEAIIISYIAMAIALVITELSLPAFNALVGKSLKFSMVFKPINLLLLFITTLISGLFSGLYSAIYLSNVVIIRTLKGNLNPRSGRSVIRKVLVISQFVIGLTLVLGTQVVSNQLRYMLTSDIGFRSENIIIIPSRFRAIKQNFDLFSNRVKELPEVENFTAMDYVIGINHNAHDFKVEGLDDNFWQYYPALIVHDNFVETFDIKIVAGRSYNSENIHDADSGILISESMVKHMGWDNKSAIGKRFNSRSGNESVMGVFKNFNAKSVHNPNEPFVLDMRAEGRNKVFASQYIAIRVVKGEMDIALSKIEDIWHEMLPKNPFRYSLLADDISNQYQFESQLSDISLVLTILSIFIASLGIIGLGSFLTAQRKKEIGIRIVLGANLMNIIAMLSKEYLQLITISLIISFVIGGIVSKLWLNTFASGTSTTTFIFILTAIVSLVIVFITVLIQSLYNAKIAPSEILKAE